MTPHNQPHKRPPLLQIAFGLATPQRVLFKAILSIPHPTPLADMTLEKRQRMTNALLGGLFGGLLAGGIALLRLLELNV